MVIDLTLDGLKLPNLPNYTPAFGKKETGIDAGVSTEDVCNDVMLPFTKQRPISITENSTTKVDATRGDVQADARLIFTTSGLSFSLGTPAVAGLKIELIAGYSTPGYSQVSYTAAGGATTKSLQAGQRITLVATASLVWEFVSTINEFFTALGEDKYPCARWLRFDFSAENKKSLKILAGTVLQFDGSAVPYYTDQDVSIDLSEELTEAGKDYNLFLVLTQNGYEFHASQNDTYSNGRRIGLFHTECEDISVSTVATIADSPSDSELRPKLLKPYHADTDPDFAAFYTKNPSSVVVNATYNTFTVPFPLAGWEAGDILPESVFCSGFHPADLLSGKGMFYEAGVDIAVDIYLQSGMGSYTRSVFGGTTTRNRQGINHEADFQMVGKQLLSDFEFLNAALGSSEKTVIAGAAEASIVTTGGHVDTAGRRIVSFSGGEDMTGTIWQWLREYGPTGGSGFSTYDGVASFGQSYGVPYQLLAGGGWAYGSSCGSRCRDAANSRSTTNAGIGGRGSSRMSATRFPLYSA